MLKLFRARSTVQDNNTQLTASMPTRLNEHGEQELLFFVHPKSTTVLSDLIRQYQHQQADCTALALSSFRTLIIAVPESDNLPRYCMAKVSLDQQINGTNRQLQHRECLLSIANTHLLRTRLTSPPIRPVPQAEQPHPTALNHFEILWDKAAICLDYKRGESYTHPAGLLYRSLPTELGQAQLLPLFTLYGVKNSEILHTLIKQSQKTPTDFLKQTLIEPYANLLIELLYQRNLSIEAHGQNLLFSLDRHGKPEKLVYRDMGGLNGLLPGNPNDPAWHSIPEDLRDPALFYLENHFIDAATAIEDHFVNRLLFNVTKQLVKTTIANHDHDFQRWKTEMKQQGYLANWSRLSEQGELDTQTDQHTPALHDHQYYRYGYVEKLFANALLDAIERNGIFDVINAALLSTDPSISTAILNNMDHYHILSHIEPTEQPLAFNADFFRATLSEPCHQRYWFKEVVLLTYSAFEFASRAHAASDM